MSAGAAGTQQVGVAAGAATTTGLAIAEHVGVSAVAAGSTIAKQQPAVAAVAAGWPGPPSAPLPMSGRPVSAREGALTADNTFCSTALNAACVCCRGAALAASAPAYELPAAARAFSNCW
ncbi:hypothetical protein MPSD_46230 [Mycobacterium pseudoshottsii JCM 15466]|nr:hypothetical protein MPSD_46230 [Mycobacterium pseudoshottsii JCM 15466]